jgi:RHS repeat-associated protein
VDADVTIQTAEFDAKGRRIKKTISNSGDLDGTTVYFYEGQKICETRDGSGNMVAQFIHGTQYIDELVMMRSAGKGDLYIHQDANFNVIGVTDLGGNLVERYVLEPYGELTVHQLSSYGDRDGDGDVDATDKGTPGTTCTGTVTGACRILDLDFDGDYDATDATLFDNLDAGNAVHPGGRFSALGQHFGHQGLWFDAEAGQYQNRARWYGSSARRFGQRDSLLSTGRPGGGYQDGLNLYAYGRGNPINWWDPSGLQVGPCSACDTNLDLCLAFQDDLYIMERDGCIAAHAFCWKVNLATFDGCAAFCVIMVNPAAIAGCMAACSVQVAIGGYACNRTYDDCWRDAVDRWNRRRLNCFDVYNNCRSTWCDLPRVDGIYY